MKISKAGKVIVFILFFLGSWSAFADQSLKHPSIARGKTLSKKILLLPIDIRVSEIAAGGTIEQVDEWSKKAQSNVNSAIRKSATQDAQIEILDLPSLKDDEKALLDNYLALYDVVGGDAHIYARGQIKGWEHKTRNFDYTLGPGLRFLRERSGADTAMFVVGSDHISSGGRKAAMVASTIFAALLGVSLIHQGAPAFILTGVVDLESGDILWMNHNLALGSRDLREADDADKMISDIFEEFPGGKQE
jgi:hypothetical protein